jgi:glycosyltransferase involved in cell wall biosynthesis
MDGYTIVIPHRNAAEATALFCARLPEMLPALRLPWEIIVVDDHSQDVELQRLSRALGHRTNARLLRLIGWPGTDAAVSAGLELARYSTIVVVDPSGGYEVTDVARLVGRLARHDLVIGRRRQTGWRKYWSAARHWPAILLRQPAVYDTNGLFFAARREALPDTPFCGGTLRFLPVLVARRGFRFDQVNVSGSGKSTLRRSTTYPLDLFATWWLAGRERMIEVEEIASDGQTTSRDCELLARPGIAAGQVIAAPRRALRDAS